MTIVKRYKLLSVIIVIFVGSLFLSGCFKKMKIYEFKSTENKFDWGEVGAKLIGEKKETSFTSISGSPYELFLWMGSDSFLEGVIQILEIKLTQAEDGKIIFVKKDKIKSPIEKTTGDYRAYFSFKNVKMNYVDAVLQTKFLLIQGDQSTEYNTEIYFEKDYKEFWRIIGV